MAKVEKTVFISYRRTNSYHALATFKHLHANGYDVFIDYEGINSGAFDKVILNQIRARAHFIVILTPSALERCTDPNDWLRREIETAIETKRNIIPLMFDGFNWGNMRQYLVGKMQILDGYNALDIPANYFDAAMERLRTRFLNVAIDAVTHPTPPAEAKAIAQKIAIGVSLPKVTEQQLSASEYFERGNRYKEAGLYADALNNYNEAIHRNPQDTNIYLQRGDTYMQTGNHDSALVDFDTAIKLNPKEASAYTYRGNAYIQKKQYDHAIADFTDSLHIDSNYLWAYVGRGNAYLKKGETDRAIADFSLVIERERINTNVRWNEASTGLEADARLGRGWAYIVQVNYHKAHKDFECAIRYNPRNYEAHIGMAITINNGVNATMGRSLFHHFDEAIKINPRLPRAYYERGRINLEG